MKLRKLVCLAIMPLIISSLFIAHAKSDLDAKEARKLIAHLAGIELSSGAVRIKEVTPLGSSALVIAQIETAFRFTKDDKGKWRVVEMRTGNNRWEDVDLIVRAINAEKAERARAELETMATALEAFRRERGFYVEAKDAGVLVDQLNPRYLARVIRIDPWHNPYNYEGTRQGFTLRSNGADGKADTSDDVTLNNQKK